MTCGLSCALGLACTIFRSDHFLGLINLASYAFAAQSIESPTWISGAESEHEPFATLDAADFDRLD